MIRRSLQIVLTSSVVLLVLTGCERRSYEAGEGTSSVATAKEGRAPMRKSELRDLIAVGMSKEEVLAIIGKPTIVNEMLDVNQVIWFYSNTDMPVIDDDTGTIINSTNIDFHADTGLVKEIRF